MSEFFQVLWNEDVERFECMIQLQTGKRERERVRQGEREGEKLERNPVKLERKKKKRRM